VSASAATVDPRTPANWAARTGFDDTAWLSGATGIGYGDNDDATVLADMQNNYMTIFCRKSFNIGSVSSVDKLILSIVVDDGFYAYLNGTQVASDNVTIDLNGFSVTGPADCSSGFPCKNRGSGVGIVTLADRSNLAIRNGTIQGVGNDAIQLRGDSILIEYMNLRGNGGDGIYVSRNTPGNIMQGRTETRETRSIIQQIGATPDSADAKSGRVAKRLSVK